MSRVSQLRHRQAPPSVAAVLPSLLRHEIPVDVQTLKDPTVFRVDELVIKLYPRTPNPLDRLRRCAASRAVHAYFRLQPVRSPEPVHWNTLAHEHYESVLVYRFAPGTPLIELWKSDDPAPLLALPQLFADLHARGVLHADLHDSNLVWGPEGWMVLDLDGVRHGLHSVRRRAITEKIWARMLRWNEDRAAGEALYREFVRLAGSPWDADASWARIEQRRRSRT